MPLCRDCTYFLPDDGRDPYRFARCEHPLTSSVNPVSGATELGMCAPQRLPLGTCGPTGVLFIQRDPIQDAPDATIGAAALG